MGLAPEEVEPRLRGRLGRPYLYVPACASTQRLLAADAPEGAVAVTDHQSQGRGRLGRSWEAPPGRALLASVRLRPAVPRDRLPELSVVVARACAEAIAELCVLRPALKAPNDVLLAGRKVAGVLCTADGGAVTAGIGVNVSQAADELPRATRLPATSLALATAGPAPDRSDLLVALLARLERDYDAWQARYRPA